MAPAWRCGRTCISRQDNTNSARSFDDLANDLNARIHGPATLPALRNAGKPSAQKPQPTPKPVLTAQK
jgi:hypothetical protein